MAISLILILCDYISSIIFLATYTPLAEACDNECVTPLPSPIMYKPYILSQDCCQSQLPCYKT